MADQFNSPQAPLPSSARANRWQDWANTILAIWLFISPWVLNFGANGQGAVTGTGAGTTGAGMAGPLGNAVWDAWVLGVIIFLISISALSRMELWQERINALLGIWVFIAPWVLGFTLLAVASWDHWVVGALVFLVSISNIAAARRRPAYDPAYAADKPRPPL